MEEQIRSFLDGLVRALLPGAVVRVTHAVEPDGRHDYTIHVHDSVRGLLIGPEGKHARAMETLAVVRALSLGWRGRVNVRVARNG